MGKKRTIALLTLILFIGNFGIAVYASPSSAVVRETVEYLMRKYSKEMTKEGVGNVTKRLGKLTAKHGDDVLPAIRKVGPRGLKMIEEAGENADKMVKLLAKHGNDGLWVASKPKCLAAYAQHGEIAANALVKHGEVAQPVIETFGKPAAQALDSLSKQQGRNLVRMANSGELNKLGRAEELLGVAGRYGDRGMKFIWQNKGALAVGTLLASFLADPEPFINGTATLGGKTTDALAENVLRRINFTPIFILLTLFGMFVISWRFHFFRRKSVPAVIPVVVSAATSESASTDDPDIPPRDTPRSEYKQSPFQFVNKFIKSIFTRFPLRKDNSDKKEEAT